MEKLSDFNVPLSWCHCCSCTKWVLNSFTCSTIATAAAVWTLTLNPVQPIYCGKKSQPQLHHVNGPSVYWYFLIIKGSFTLQRQWKLFLHEWVVCNRMTLFTWWEMGTTTATKTLLNGLWTHFVTAMATERNNAKYTHMQLFCCHCCCRQSPCDQSLKLHFIWTDKQRFRCRRRHSVNEP